MPAAQIHADHDELKNIATTFNQQGDAVEQILQSIMSKYEGLTGGGWIGEGERKYEQEQESFTHPTIKRLSKALHAAGRITNQISKTFQDAEEEAGSALGPQ
jgi:WXG100 family type VII secretion target